MVPKIQVPVSKMPTYIALYATGEDNKTYPKRYATAAGFARSVVDGSGLTPLVLVTSDGRDLTDRLYGLADDIETLYAQNPINRPHFSLLATGAAAPSLMVTPATSANLVKDQEAARKAAVSKFRKALARDIENLVVTVPHRTEVDTFGIHGDYQEVTVPGVATPVHTKGFRWSKAGDLMVEFHYRYNLAPIDARNVTPV